MAPRLLDLISQYPILETLASYISTRDLFHLGLTSQAYHAYILATPTVFEALRRFCLCDGRGLQRRIRALDYKYLDRIDDDPEIEVRLYAKKCDEAGALPCRKCGINICEECRVCPRVAPNLPPYRSYPERRPHLSSSGDVLNIMCLCDTCDAALEEQLRGKFLNELCDCDRYRRWICPRCSDEETIWSGLYYNTYTAAEERDGALFWERYEKSKLMDDGEYSEVIFWCMCGANVPQEARPRCTWCKRRHRPESEWADELREMEAIPYDDGSYPIARPYQRSYPELAYKGPIYQDPYKDTEA
ncbi:hypothetical protein F4805DRAFT_23021 [Annulohypoxylon moriforme]|nr:hypothetical protein F4805DRAFT_23021 [Annulohypoxylon moriforme]